MERPEPAESEHREMREADCLAADRGAVFPEEYESADTPEEIDAVETIVVTVVQVRVEGRPLQREVVSTAVKREVLVMPDEDRDCGDETQDFETGQLVVGPAGISVFSLHADVADLVTGLE